jgi:galactokinase/mevalonate kinase-like predicted kinase
MRSPTEPATVLPVRQDGRPTCRAPSAVASPTSDIYRAKARHRARALGGMVTGADGGGCMLCCCECDKKHHGTAALARVGAHGSDVSFDLERLRQWTTHVSR